MSLHGLAFTEQELHRDDHYMFILQTSGHFACEVDFNKLKIRNSGLLYVAPGQVHRYIKVEKSKGWLLFIHPDYISKQFRTVFDTIMNVNQNVSVPIGDPVFSFAGNLEEWWSGPPKNDELKFSIGRSLLDAISGMIASKLLGAAIPHNRTSSSKHALTNQFKQLIKEHFKELKQVKQYAALLHITPLYLNEVMSETTGLSASYWIHQEILLEAKRLLAYSGKNIREIAWELGYEDFAYFSRFFKKNTGSTASAFRNQKP